ncbi:hypothetical protein BDN71DRAFT_222754 [Pleurotus eryngii]|uniref:Uncharacterized protein n=1 Tax=Pleurotus eryngii TaxID=5323 RepID=A0A9P6A4K5_PLEER|nr:hypothetical protein BDN71DRAFT_222754 [Pleurotus eryngii]
MGSGEAFERATFIFELKFHLTCMLLFFALLSNAFVLCSYIPHVSISICVSKTGVSCCSCIWLSTMCLSYSSGYWRTVLLICR